MLDRRRLMLSLGDDVLFVIRLAHARDEDWLCTHVIRGSILLPNK
mgnify:CR=1 FL=1